jgi:hypothetical protein
MAQCSGVLVDVLRRNGRHFRRAKRRFPHIPFRHRSFCRIQSLYDQLIEAVSCAGKGTVARNRTNCAIIDSWEKSHVQMRRYARLAMERELYRHATPCANVLEECSACTSASSSCS